MSKQPVMQHAYVVHRSRAEAGDVKALHSLLSMVQHDFASLALFGNLPPALQPLVKSLASEAENVKNYVWGFRDGHDFGHEQARTRSRKRKQERLT